MQALYFVIGLHVNIFEVPLVFVWVQFLLQLDVNKDPKNENFFFFK